MSHSGEMGDASLAAFTEFIEAQFITFAEGYFGETSLTRPTSVPT